MSDVGKALRLKEEGNRLFLAQNYIGAESVYSKAIIADSANPALYTNRAMSRIKLGLWDLVVDDCCQALQQDPQNMKAFYQLSQAQLELHDYQVAVESALRAKELATKNNDKSLPNILNQLRKAIRTRWDDKERRRLRETGPLEEETIAMYEERKQTALKACNSETERGEVEAEWETKIKMMRDIYEMARSEGQKERTIPEWLECSISFELMTDPVVSRLGHTYDRRHIMEHLKNKPIDPYTKEPLYPHDLRPNLALKKACESFLEKNGWAVE